MGQMVEIQIGDFRPTYKYDLNNVECQRGDFVILEVEKGSEFGRVVSDVTRECSGKVETAKGKLLRRATEGDLKQIQNNRMKAIDSRNVCMRKINERRLPMQLVKTEYTFDSSKIVFFFTAEGRIDFRNLVKDLAKVFRVRIELKQIGVRDKAKVVGGFGVCGRELCCSSFLKSFHSLSIKMAKEQQLPLNPSRISGMCGRIKCCMAYEFSAYRELSRSMPHVGDKIDTPDGKGRVMEINVLKRIATLDLGEGKIVRTVIPKGAEKKFAAVVDSE